MIHLYPETVLHFSFFHYHPLTIEFPLEPKRRRKTQAGVSVLSLGRRFTLCRKILQGPENDHVVRTCSGASQ